MADVLAGLLGGMAAGKKANADRAAAEAKARQEEAEWQLKLAQESRLLRAQAESEWQQMETATTADDWDPAMLPSLLDRAMRFDATYGSVWKGKSAFKYFGEAMHATPQKVSGALPAGVQGPPSPDTEQASPLAGFRSEAQMAASDKLHRDLRTRQVMPQIRSDLNRILAPLRDSGMLNPVSAYAAIQQYEGELTAKYDLDPLEVEKIVDDAEAAIADASAEIFKQQGRGEDYNKELAQASQRMSAWARSITGLDRSLFDSETDYMAAFKSKEPLLLRIEDFVQRKLAAGAPENLIKWEAMQRYKDAAGLWSLDVKSMPHFVELANAPKEVRTAAEALYGNEQVQDDQMEPVSDGAGNWFLVSPVNGARIQFWPPSNDVSRITPAGSAQDGATATDGGRQYRKVNGQWELVEDANRN